MCYARNTTQTAVGEPEAIRRLGNAVSQYNKSVEFAVRWVSVYPSGGRYGHVITYDKKSSRLVHDLDGTTYSYDNVTPDVLRSLASEAQNDFVTTEDLTRYGCSESY